MKALVFQGPGQRAWEEVADPAIIEPTDALVRIDTTTICGTDLHILAGDVPAVTPGRTLGHEGVGTVIETGTGCTRVTAGQRVIVSCICRCGTCTYCLRGLPSHCQTLGGIGWVFGHLINGTQAEYVRVPFADNGLVPVPAGVTDEQAVMLSDILPTGYEIGVQYGGVRESDVVAVVGAGPVGLAAIMTARPLGASRIVAVDSDAFRLQSAREFGATDVIDIGAVDDVATALKAMSSDGLGVDVAIEAVGIPQTFTTCLTAIRPGGVVANVGVHGKPVEFPIQQLWIDNITVRTGLVNTTTTEDLLSLITAHEIAPERFATHHFKLSQIMEAYDVFAAAAAHQALKVVLTA